METSHSNGATVKYLRESHYSGNYTAVRRNEPALLQKKMYYRTLQDLALAYASVDNFCKIT